MWPDCALKPQPVVPSRETGAVGAAEWKRHGLERHLGEHASSVRARAMVTRGEISRGTMISRRGRIARTGWECRR
jgi:hypothetical protein